MNELTIILLTMIGSLLGSLLASYMKEKGKNLATKEDIEEITEKVEGIKVSYQNSLESFKSSLARGLSVVKIQIDFEVSAYVAICDKLGLLRAKYYQIMPRESGSESHDQKMTSFFREFHDDLGKIQILLDQKSPFFEPAIKEKVFKIMGLAWERSIDSQVDSRFLKQDYWSSEEEVRADFVRLNEELYTMITHRINEMKEG